MPSHLHKGAKKIDVPYVYMCNRLFGKINKGVVVLRKIETCKVPFEKLRKTYEQSEEKNWIEQAAACPLNGLDPQSIIGQDRAVRSMHFGLEMNVPGYNMMVVGPPGTGKSTYVEAVLRQTSKTKETPRDWCYLYNFHEPDKPIAVSLLPGEGKEFRQDMEVCIEEFKQNIPKAFEKTENERQKGDIINHVQDQVDQYTRHLKEEAKDAGFILKQSPQQLFFVPYENEKQMKPEEYDRLPLNQRKKMEQQLTQLEQKLESVLLKMRHLEKEAAEQINLLYEKIVRSITEPTIEQLKNKYGKYPKICIYLEDVQQNISDHHHIFQRHQETKTEQVAWMEKTQDPFLSYEVNLFVNNEAKIGAPAIIEPFTNYYNVFGKIEYQSQLTNTTTDFTRIKAGAIHQANGGYLVLQAKDLLFDPLAWETLKKWLKMQEATIENMGDQYRYVPTVTLRPEPIPLQVKIILIGSPIFYHLLSQDEDFSKLFKVKVDFDIEMPRNKENVHHYVIFIESICRTDNLLPFHSTAMGEIIDYGSRLAGNQEKLSTQFNDIQEIIHESHMIAMQRHAEKVEKQDVLTALHARSYRSGLIQDKMHERIEQNKIMIQTKGKVVGQVNGLAVMELDRFAFGIPARITAQTFAGTAGITNIERETETSGSTHSKGVLTLAGYLGGKFAQNEPLGLSAQITFEQTYGGVEGDSASSTELYALLSSLSGIPLKQNLAVTGSINQHGEIQPIGGVTEKVEGFFDICKIKGFTGDQGVIIPFQNVDDLMLKEEVLNEIRQDNFHVYEVHSVEEGIELLTDKEAGILLENGTYTPDSVFSYVQKKIKHYTDHLKIDPAYINIKREQ